MTRKGKKHRKPQDNPPEVIKSGPGCPAKRNEIDEVHIGTRPYGIGPSEPCREVPRDAIYLIHSREQEDFASQLRGDLKRNFPRLPVCDWHKDCNWNEDGRMIECTPDLILEAARQCRVALLVISDEFFTRSKWPMIELNEFVKAQGSTNKDLKILPLFLGITMEQFFDKQRQACWFEKWEEFARVDERIMVEEWKGTLSKIPGGINAVEYTGVAEQVKFREEVVKAICSILPPEVKYDVSHVQSLELLCEPIEKKLREVEVSSRFKVKVVGLYGMLGTGKTTIAKAICIKMLYDYFGRVCLLELSENSVRLDLKVRSRREVLQNLTDAKLPFESYLNMSSLEKDLYKLDDLMKEHMHQHPVFLVLDDVCDHDIEEALKYLETGYHAKSMVLVISRSIDILKELGIEECNCIEMSDLNEEGAMDLLLHHSGISRESIVDESEWKILRRCTKLCYFSKGKESRWKSNQNFIYHPLALIVMGYQLASTKLKDWNKILGNISRRDYDSMPMKLRTIFLDLALLWPHKWTKSLVHIPIAHGHILEWEWLCTLHSVSEDEMIANVKALQQAGILDQVHDITDLKSYNIHELYYEFANEEPNRWWHNTQRTCVDGEEYLEMRGGDVDTQTRKPNASFWRLYDNRLILGECYWRLYDNRLILRECEGTSLKVANLLDCKNLEVLFLSDCSKLEEVDLTGMENLKLMVVYACKSLGKLTGLETLRNLVYFYRREDPNCETIRMGYVFGSTKLRAVRLWGIQGRSNGDVISLDLNNCTNLHPVAILPVEAE